MEMNTRLQVEHGITEKITGLDLVEIQIKIAEGKKLNLKQENITLLGHAIEARIYAESPEEDYKPCPGKIHKFETFKSKHIRNDIGFVSGDEVTSFYDSMLAKIISHGKTRKEAVNNINEALVKTKIYGIKNNKYLLSKILSNKEIINGNYTTKFLANNIKNLNKFKYNINDKLKYSLANIWIENRLKKNNFDDSLNIWMSTNRFRANLKSQEELKFIEGDKEIIVLIKYINENKIFKSLNGNIINPYKEPLQGEVIDNKIYIQDIYKTRIFNFSNTLSFKEEQDNFGKGLKSPMPGKVVKVFFKSGEKIESNSVVMMIEAMKMEHSIISNKSGIIKKLNYKVGDWVDEGSLLVEI